MARPKDNSLKYYNQDTKDDDNLQYVEAIHSFIGYAVVHKLWKHIYGGPGGYYCLWDDINKMLFCKNNGITLDQLNSILETCYQEGIEIFSREMAEKHKILTSKGIQKRWTKIVKEAGRSNNKVDKLHRLINLQDENHQETTPPLQLVCDESTQSKVNVKVNESKEKRNECEGELLTPSNFLNSNSDKSEKRMSGAKFLPPAWEEVNSFFFGACKNFWDAVKAGKVARKFYNHYTSLNWRTTSGADVQHWQSKAEDWINQDREAERKKGVPHEKVKSQLTDEQKEAKTVAYIESVFKEFCTGTIVESGIPADFYDFLKEKEMLLLSSEETNNLFQRCNSDPIKSKKKAVAEYFDRLKKQGLDLVFQLQK